MTNEKDLRPLFLKIINTEEYELYNSDNILVATFDVELIKNTRAYISYYISDNNHKRKSYVSRGLQMLLDELLYKRGICVYYIMITNPTVANESFAKNFGFVPDTLSLFESVDYTLFHSESIAYLTKKATEIVDPKEIEEIESEILAARRFMIKKNKWDNQLLEHNEQEEKLKRTM